MSSAPSQDATVLHQKPPASVHREDRSPTGKPDVGEKEGKGVRHRTFRDCAWPGSGAAGVRRQLAGSRVEGGGGVACAHSTLGPRGRGEPRRRMISVGSTPCDCTKVASFDIPENSPQELVNNLALQAMLVSARGNSLASELSLLGIMNPCDGADGPCRKDGWRLPGPRLGIPQRQYVTTQFRARARYLDRRRCTE